MKARMTVLALLCVPTVALAQVGHSPSGSPYRDIRKGHTITVTGGYFGGSGGQFDIGPHRGEAFGGRYDIRSASTMQIGFAVAQGNLERFIVDPILPLENRVTGPVKQSVTFAELALQFNITGGKSWHRIAPFIGAGVGLAIARRHAGRYHGTISVTSSTWPRTPDSGFSSPIGSTCGEKRGQPSGS